MPSCWRCRRAQRDGHRLAHFLNAGAMPIEQVAPSAINYVARAQVLTCDPPKKRERTITRAN